MIIDILLNSLYFVLNLVIFPITSLPDVILSNEFSDAISTMKPYYSSLSTILPLGTLLAIIAFEIVVDTAILAYRLIRWGYQKIPFIN